MRLLVTGDRNWGRVQEPVDATKIRVAKMEREYLYSVLDACNVSPGVSELIVGDAKGADEFAKRWAIDRKVALAKNMQDKREPFKADWDQHGKSAGPIRNREMLFKDGGPDAVIAFHRDFMNSKGTKHMVTIALDEGIMCSIHPSVHLERA